MSIENIISIKMVLDDKIISIHQCKDRGYWYIIHKVGDVYVLSFFTIKDNTIDIFNSWVYKNLSSARRKAKGFYDEYIEVSLEDLEENLKENKIIIKNVLTEDNIVL